MNLRLFPIFLASILLLTSCNLPAMQAVPPTLTSSPLPPSPPTLAITAQPPFAASQTPPPAASTSLSLPPTATFTLPPATSTSTSTSLPPAPSFTPLPTDTAAPLPSRTQLPPSATRLPTATSKPPVSPTRAPTASVPGKQFVTIYLIALEDNGKSGPLVGCSDSAVPVQVELIPHTLGVLRASMQKLLAVKDRFYGQSGLYDALWQSDLIVQDVTLTGGAAVIHLTGTLRLGGECDNPRVAAQLLQTARQFSTVQTVTIYINGKTLQQALSLK